MPRVTLRDIAQQVGYSKNTVSLALRGDPQIPEKTREKIRSTAHDMGYKPNPVVSQLMAELRASQTPRFQAKLALVNANLDPKAFREHPTIPPYVEGCERRAAKLGYSFDKFWLHDPNLTADRWIRIMRTRNIKGVILVGLMDQNHLPEHLAKVWEHFPAVVTGVRTRKPTLPFCCVDHFNLSLAAFEKAMELGYKRPALIMDDVIDRLVDRRFSAGFLIGQDTLPENQHVPPFMQMNQARQDPKLFHDWFWKEKPDVMFTLYNTVFKWLEAIEVKVPEDVGIIQLEWRAQRPDVAGLHQHNDMTGEAAVDMIIGRIHNNEHGVPDYPRASMVGVSWIDGQTVRKQSTRRKKSAAQKARRKMANAK